MTKEVLYAQTPINEELVDISVNIILPLNSTNGRMLSDSDITWEDALVNNQEDFIIDNLKFKNLNLQVECDVFQYIFLFARA